MSGYALETAQVEHLLRRQELLQAEAHQVLAELNLPAVLARAGQPVQVGSSVLGLMVWRDIDFNVLCDPLSADRAFETVRPLASNPRVRKLRYSNETQHFNATGLPQDEGYYWGVRYHTAAGDEWKIDIWFVPRAVPRPEIALLATLPKRLTPQTRLAILSLKDIWHRLPAYRDRVLSVDIYDAVLEHGVRTPAEFDAYLVERGKPAREVA